MIDIEKSLITANMQSKTGFPSSHQLNSYGKGSLCFFITLDFSLPTLDLITRVGKDPPAIT